MGSGIMVGSRRYNISTEASASAALQPWCRYVTTDLYKRAPLTDGK